MATPKVRLTARTPREWIPHYTRALDHIESPRARAGRRLEMATEARGKGRYES